MRAIILAAGKGSRLNGTRAGKPKCLVEVGGSSLLSRQIDAVRGAGIGDIAIVVGFMADSIRGACDDRIQFVENPDWADTSSLYSLWCARALLADGFVVLNSDVLFHPRLLSDLLGSEHPDALLLSDTGAAPMGEEEMKVMLRDRRVVDMSKQMHPDEADGENVGIVKFSAGGAARLVGYLDALVANGGRKDWAPRAFLEFARHHPLRAVSTRGLPWIEIDFPEDYQRAVREVLPSIEATPP